MPIPHARVTLTGSHNNDMAVVTLTDGAFSFDVPQDKYTLIANHGGWQHRFGMIGPSSGFGSAIVTGPDQDTAHLAFRWFRPGAIFGKVVDDRGDAVENALVQLVRETVVVGRKVTVVAGNARTDDLGNYRVGPIAGGIYYVGVTGSPWYSQQARPFPGDTGDAQLNVAYAPTYFPNSTDPQNASRLVLEAGGEVEANFTLRLVAGVTVHPLCAAENCSGTMSLYAVGVGGLEALVSTSHFLGDRPVLGVAPGHYIARIAGPGGTMRKVVDIGSGGATVEFSPQPAPKLTGQLQYKNGAKPRASVYLRMLNADTNTSVGIPIAADGSFSYASVPIARLRPQVVGNAGLFISKMSATGAPLQDGAIEVQEGATVHLEIEASDESGRVRGLVKQDDKPAPAVLVVLVPRDNPADTDRYHGFQTESDGSYDFTVVPAGEYLLFTTDRVDLEYANPNIVRPYLASAKAVRVEPHEVCTADLVLKPQ